MPRKILYILTLIVVLALAGGVWFWFSYIHTPEPAPQVTEENPQRGFFSFFGDYFGGDPDSDTPTPESGDPDTVTPAFSFRERLFKEKMISLSNAPLSGGTFALMRVGTTTPALFDERVRYVERETGHIIDLSIETGETERISNTTIPGIQETIWGASGRVVALRYLEDDNETIETFAATLPTTTPVVDTDLEGVFFPQNITSLGIHPASGDVFYVIGNQDGSAGRIANIRGQNTRTLFSSPLREWLAAWTNPAAITLSTKPSAQAVGSVYAVSPGTGAMTRLTPSTSGLTVLVSGGGTHVLYASANASEVSLFILEVGTQETWEVPLTTLPEKCVFRGETNIICAVPNTIPNNVPDLWYQGRTSFSDTIWAIDTETRLVDFLISPDEVVGGSVDGTFLSISSDGTIISFLNKKDLRGWIADVSPNNN